MPVPIAAVTQVPFYSNAGMCYRAQLNSMHARDSCRGTRHHLREQRLPGSHTAQPAVRHTGRGQGH